MTKASEKNRSITAKGAKNNDKAGKTASPRSFKAKDSTARGQSDQVVINKQ